MPITISTSPAYSSLNVDSETTVNRSYAIEKPVPWAPNRAGGMALFIFCFLTVGTFITSSSAGPSLPRETSWWPPAWHPAPAPTAAPATLCPEAFCSAMRVGLADVNMQTTTLRTFCDGSVGHYDATLAALKKGTRGKCMAQTLCSGSVLGNAGDDIIATLIDSGDQTFIWDQKHSDNDTPEDDDCSKLCDVINDETEKYAVMGARTCAQLYDDDDYNEDNVDAAHYTRARSRNLYM